MRWGEEAAAVTPASSLKPPPESLPCLESPRGQTSFPTSRPELRRSHGLNQKEKRPSAPTRSVPGGIVPLLGCPRHGALPGGAGRRGTARDPPRSPAEPRQSRALQQPRQRSSLLPHLPFKMPKSHPFALLGSIPSTPRTAPRCGSFL